MPINTPEPGVFRAAFPIHYSDADAAGFLRLTSLLNFLQIQAGNHTQSVGFDYLKHRGEDTFWVLSRMTVKIDSWPTYPQDLTVDTWSRSTKAVLALRDFRFGTDAGWNGRASSAWVMLKDRKPQRPEPWVAIYTKTRVEEPVTEMPASLPAFETAAPVSRVRADWEDVDMNGHVNNVNGIGWCLASHDFEFLHAWRPTYLEANFLAEMFCDQDYAIDRVELPGEGRTFDYRVTRVSDGTVTLRLRLVFQTQ